MYCIPHVSYPDGHAAQAGEPPVAYCPAAHSGVDVGDTISEGVRVGDAFTTANSRASNFDGDFDGVGVFEAVDVALPERVGVVDVAGVLVGVRVAAGDLLEVIDDAGVLVVEMGTHDPQVDATYPDEQVPVKKGSQQESESGHRVPPSAREIGAFTNPTDPSHSWYPVIGSPNVSVRVSPDATTVGGMFM